MPMVKFPYTKKGEEKAKAAAKQYGGKFVSDEKASKKGNGASVVIAVGSARKPKPKSKKKKMAYGGMVAKKNKK